MGDCKGVAQLRLRKGVALILVGLSRFLRSGPGFGVVSGQTSSSAALGPGGGGVDGWGRWRSSGPGGALRWPWRRVGPWPPRLGRGAVGGGSPGRRLDATAPLGLPGAGEKGLYRRSAGFRYKIPSGRGAMCRSHVSELVAVTPVQVRRVLVGLWRWLATDTGWCLAPLMAVVERYVRGCLTVMRAARRSLPAPLLLGFLAGAVRAVRAHLALCSSRLSWLQGGLRPLTASPALGAAAPVGRTRPGLPPRRSGRRPTDPSTASAAPRRLPMTATTPPLAQDAGAGRTAEEEV
ncbi:hypothetical protein SMICM17S_06367 [Streptomyces microflavus]